MNIRMGFGYWEDLNPIDEVRLPKHWCGLGNVAKLLRDKDTMVSKAAGTIGLQLQVSSRVSSI